MSLGGNGSRRHSGGTAASGFGLQFDGRQGAIVVPPLRGGIEGHGECRPLRDANTMEH
jgi:hypothetical protein